MPALLWSIQGRPAFARSFRWGFLQSPRRRLFIGKRSCSCTPTPSHHSQARLVDYHCVFLKYWGHPTVCIKIGGPLSIRICTLCLDELFPPRAVLMRVLCSFIDGVRRLGLCIRIALAEYGRGLGWKGAKDTM